MILYYSPFFTIQKLETFQKDCRHVSINMVNILNSLTYLAYIILNFRKDTLIQSYSAHRAL